jgi:hypothetical protein
MALADPRKQHRNAARWRVTRIEDGPPYTINADGVTGFGAAVGPLPTGAA